jgi:cell division protein FtsN
MMSKHYNGQQRRRSRIAIGSSLLTGILIGIVLGLSVALGVAWYINKMPSPFAARTAQPTKTDPGKTPAAQTAKIENKNLKTEDSKPRFDFYKILPGSEEPAPEKAPRDAKSGSTAGAREAFFLQAGAFQNAPDADNLKARLALLGIEASIETTVLPEKGIWHRVRIGPYASIEELNRTRDTLKQNGVQTTLVKARETER